ncbi:dimethyl sulfoxide reductase anchor subunit family protein [Enterobacter sp.]|uniref:dimethyl sulfoxide reductase anchor subunit family protein n=1 Tax=Enterobacter sp. TaxID=42895 RepID=UPI00296FDF61|nr:DmsC/YnfH family molybdoenzyme membrane anchor subunit [Enterobacter sp.]
MHELPLLLFTLLLQGSVGITLWLALLPARGTPPRSGLLLAFIMASLGLLASTLHMGYPLNALNALRHVASSWLSREIVFASLYLGALGLCTLLALWRKPGGGLLVPVTALFGVIDVFCMAQIYINTAVITWQHLNTLILFAGTTGIVGSVYAALSAPDIRRRHVTLAVMVVALVVLIRLLVQPLWMSALSASPQIVTLPHNPLAAFEKLRTLYTLSWAVSAAGMIIFGLGGIRKAKKLLLAGSGLLLLAEIGLRFIFFSIG